MLRQFPLYLIVGGFSLLLTVYWALIEKGFRLTREGVLVLVDLGFVVAGGEGSKAGGPSHLRRYKRLGRLSDTDAP